jgi:hypothetical protein
MTSTALLGIAAAQADAAAPSNTISASPNGPEGTTLEACQIWIHGHHVPATNGTVEFRYQADLGPADQRIDAANWTGTPEPDGTGSTFTVGPFSVPTVGTAPRFSIFTQWTNESGDHIAATDVLVTCTPTAKVPFFPTPASLALGVLGAGGLVGLVTWRRRR